MKALRMTGMTLAVLAALLVLGAMTVAAQGPVANLTPMSAPYIDNQAHPIPADTSVWYKFDYSVNHDTGVRPITTITLLYGNASGVTFDVWDANTATDTADNTPIGRGGTYTVNTDSGTITSSNLDWVGALGDSGTYYVRVTNPNSYDTTAQLMISGDGVSLAPIAVTGVSASAQPTTTTDDPNKAVALNGTQQTIPADSAMWFSFDYTVDTDSGVHPVKTITLVNGSASGLSFQVYSPDLLNDWWQNTPIGVGTSQMIPSESGMVQSPDLTWSGAFGGSGTYYVRVINNTNSPIPAVLTIQ
jgi:hypothetical protein